MRFKLIALAITASVASASAMAETPYNQLITNTAQLNYSVAGGATVTATPATADFKVDRLVKFNLTPNTTASNAPVGEKTTVGFTLTNNSNAPIDYTLANLTDVIYYVDLNGDGTLDANEEIDSNKITGNISLLQNDGSANFDGHIENFLAVYTPQQGVDGTTQEIIFNASAVENDASFGTVGDPIVPTPATEAWDKDTAQTVAETDADGNFVTTQSQTITYTYVGANIALAKAVEVVSDPISLGANPPAGYQPKAIPGAILKYTITVTNSGSKDAALTLSDTMPSIFAESDINANSYMQSINGGAAVSLSNVIALTDTSNNIVTLTFPNVTATAKNGSDNGTVITTFEVTLP